MKKRPRHHVGDGLRCVERPQPEPMLLLCSAFKSSQLAAHRESRALCGGSPASDGSRRPRTLTTRSRGRWRDARDERDPIFRGLTSEGVEVTLLVTYCGRHRTCLEPPSTPLTAPATPARDPRRSHAAAPVRAVRAVLWTSLRAAGSRPSRAWAWAPGRGSSRPVTRPGTKTKEKPSIS